MEFGALMFFTDYAIPATEFARALEARGFESVWAPEHSHIPTSRKSPWPGGGELPKVYYEAMDPFVSLTAAAVATKTLKLATGVCLVQQRDPIQTAKLVASIDQISDGRFFFGVGGGWNAEEMADHGTEFRTRFKLVRERIEAMKNYRFAQPGRTHRQHIARWFPEFQFPFADLTIFDPVTRKIDGRLARCEETNTCPDIFEANSENEFWAKGGSMLLTDGQGRDLDLRRTPNVRYYQLSSLQHGTGNSTTTGICRQLGNPLSSAPVERALLVDLDQWVSEGVPPPANRVPSISGGTLVPPLPQSGQGFPNIPNPQTTLPATPFVAYNGVLHTGDLWDFGPKFDNGIVSIIPPISLGTPYKIYVPKTDADGNDIAGIRVPSVTVPIATYTGWGLRAGDAADPVPIVDGCDATGQYIPFPTTIAQRMATGDPRPSLQERYGNPAGTNADYVAKVQAAAQALVAERFLLEEPGIVQDIETYTTPAMSVTIPANP